MLLGEALALGSAEAVSSLFGLERRAIQTYMLLGDPATPLDPGAPRLYATANDQPVSTGVRYQPGRPATRSCSSSTWSTTAGSTTSR